MSDDLELWRESALAPGYLVSSLGRVRRRGTERVLAGGVTSRGYRKHVLAGNRQQYAHRLVAHAFHGPPPSPAHQVDHLDWNRLNNAAANLRWLPLLENRCRWQDRTPDGRNVWQVQDKRADPPAGWTPMTDLELDDLTRELAAAGWTEGAHDDGT